MKYKLICVKKLAQVLKLYFRSNIENFIFILINKLITEKQLNIVE